MDDDTMKVKITNGFDFGTSIMCAVIFMLVFAALGVAGIDWLTDKFSDHKEKYIISFEDQSYGTADYDRKWSGQVTFYDCGNGDRVIVNPSVGVVKVAKIDPQVAKACKTP